MACTNINGLRNRTTPADIFIGLKDCLDKGDYENAGQLYLAALVYGRYDIKRVEDKSSHQAISVLRLKYLGGLGKDKIQKLQLALKKSIKNMSAICTSLKRLGKPNYYPRYMIQHGMGAFLGNKSKDGIVANFNSNKAWQDVLVQYAKCSL